MGYQSFEKDIGFSHKINEYSFLSPNIKDLGFKLYLHPKAIGFLVC